MDGLRFYSSSDPLLRQLSPPPTVHQNTFGPLFFDPNEPNTVLLDCDWVNGLRKHEEYRSILRFEVKFHNVQEFLQDPYKI